MPPYFRPWVRTQLLEMLGKIDLTDIEIAAANTDGGVVKAGTSSDRVVSDVAGMKFMSFYFDNGALTGDSRGMYLRLYITGAGGGGEALRVFTTVEDVAAYTAHGAHISLNFGDTGSVIGQGIAGRNTLHIPNDASWTPGTIAALQAEIWSDGTDSDTDGATQVSFIRVVNGGHADGISDVDDDAFLIALSGGSDGTGKVVFDSTARVSMHGNTRYLVMSSAENVLKPIGEFRIDLSDVTIAAANTDGGVFKAGTSGARVVEDTAGMNFMSAYFDNGANSGDSRGFYLRLYLTGAGGGGEALRVFTDVEDVEATTARGAHISLKFGTSGSITGLGTALTTTLHIPGAMAGGTYVGLKSEIWADGAGSDLAGASLAALIQLGLGGDSGGVSALDVNTTRFIDFGGFTPNAGAILDTNITALSGLAGLAVTVDGVLYGYIPVVTGS